MRRRKLKFYDKNKTIKRKEFVSSNKKGFAGRARRGKRKISYIVNDVLYNENAQKDFTVLQKRFDYSEKFSALCENEAIEIDGSFLANKKTIAQEKSLIGRKNYCDECVFTIDGEDAKDFDDAVSITKNAIGYLLIVHIADVSYFVKKKSHLLKEALQRGTSVYCIHKVLPMLPEVLSNKWCSLLPGKYRLTFSCAIQYDGKGVVQNYSFHKSIIKSKQQVSYKQAENSLQKKQIIGNGVDEALIEMQCLAKILRSNRIKEGSIDFNFPQQDWKIKAGVSSSALVKENIFILLTKRLESEMIIEDFMLAANKLAAQEMLKKGMGIFRVHGAPSDEKKFHLLHFLRQHGITLPKKGTENPLFQKGENKFQLLLNGLEEGEFKEVVSYEVLKSMDKAYYNVENLGHYGLGFLTYAHFTSPIRRICDLMVHYVLSEEKIKEGGGQNKLKSRTKKKTLKNKKHFLSTNYLEDVAKTASFQERKAVEAEREYKKIKAIRYLNNMSPTKTFLAVVVGFSSLGLCFVRLLQTGIEGQLQFDNWNELFYDGQQKILWQGNTEVASLGEKVQVKVKALLPSSLQILFELF